MVNKYLQNKVFLPPQIPGRPSGNLGLVVVIPAHREPHLFLSLKSLQKCELPACDVEILVVINGSEKDSELVRQHHIESYYSLSSWAKDQHETRRKFHFLLFPELPAMHAGVGMARKIGMDEAAWRLEKAGNPEGIISCFDADSRCDPNYLKAIENHFLDHPKQTACSIYYEHPLSGADFEQEVYDAITEYELHLRYYITAQRWAGFPFAYHTIGSSMAVKSADYQKQGGMNRRQAGEDFYFLQKFIEIGRLGECNATRVIPSPRPSDRVPFGTGKAVGVKLKGKKEILTYNPESFIHLKGMLGRVGELYSLKDKSSVEKWFEEFPFPLKNFFLGSEVGNKWEEIRKHTGGKASFTGRFYRWFNAFRLMKYLHYCREEAYSDIPVNVAASRMLEMKGDTGLKSATSTDLLLRYRELDRTGNWDSPFLKK